MIPPEQPFTNAPVLRTLTDIETLEAGTADPLAGCNSTYELLSRGARRHPAAPALSFFLQTQDHRRPFVWSHGAWLQRITQTAHALHRLGIGRQDVVAYLLPNLPETHWVIWGAEAVGVAFAINPLLEAPMIAELLKAARPKVLVTLAPTPGTDLWEKASEAAAQVDSLTQVVTVTPLRYLRGAISPAVRLVSRLRAPRRMGRLPCSDLHALLRHAPGDTLPGPPPRLDDVASYFCTGGTTGLPKIAVRTHRTEVANALQVAAMFGPEMGQPGRSIFCGLPLFHVNAQIGTGLAAWSAGAHVVLGTPQGYRAPGLVANFWHLAEHYRFMSFSGVPTVYAALLQHPPKGQDISSLRYGICGAAPMPLELFQRFQTETGIKVLEGYGLTEGGCVSSLNPPGGETRFGSIGLRVPFQAMKVAVLDDAGQYLRDAEVGEAGVLLIHGPNLFRGYLDPSHNQGLWVTCPTAGGAPQPWLNTGDLGRRDAQGYFWLTGRRKELIIRGGHNIDPKQIEEAMHHHAAVALAAAIGRPDPHAGEVPVVYVQLRPGTSASPEDLLRVAQARVAERAAWPKEVMVLDTLPTTAIGKIYKPALSVLELERAVRETARGLGLALRSCQARQDPRQGLVVQWQAEGDAAPLRQALDRFAFRHQELSDSN